MEYQAANVTERWRNADTNSVNWTVKVCVTVTQQLRTVELR